MHIKAKTFSFLWVKMGQKLKNYFSRLKYMFLFKLRFMRQI